MNAANYATTWFLDSTYRFFCMAVYVNSVYESVLSLASSDLLLSDV